MLPVEFGYYSHLLSIPQCYYFSEEEKKLVEEVFNNAIDSLSDEDKKLPQVQIMPLLLPVLQSFHQSYSLSICISFFFKLRKMAFSYLYVNLYLQ